MLKEAVTAITDEKKLSYNHWRYRLLHWCFSVKDPDRSHLPRFFYTHYCPLFHMTNMIALFSPFIFGFKIVALIFKIIGSVFCAINNFCEARSEQITAAKQAAFDALSDDEKYAMFIDGEEAYFRKRMLKSLARDPNLQFSDFWPHNSYHFTYLKSDRAEVLWISYFAKIIEANEILKARREKFKERMVIWVNLSRVVIKIALVAMYVTFAAVAIYLGYHYAIPCAVAIIKFIASDKLIVLFWICMKLLLAGATIAFVLISIERLINTFNLTTVIAPPFTAMKDMIFGFFKWIRNTIKSFCEFMAMFYEEHCPPIKIVNDADAEIAAIEE